MNIVGGALFKEEELLLIKRAGARKVWPGLWEIPGGRVEKGETPAHALNREFQEEAGLADRLVKKYCTIRYDYQGTPATEDDYIVATDRFEITLSEEHTAFRWATEQTIDKLKMSPQMKESIKKAFSAMVKNKVNKVNKSWDSSSKS